MTLDDKARMTRDLSRAARRRREAELDFRARLLAAHSIGLSLAQISSAVDLSKSQTHRLIQEAR